MLLFILLIYYGSVALLNLIKFCTSLNIIICTLLKLPYNTHTFYLGPLIGQLHLRHELYIIHFRFYGIFPDYQIVFFKPV